MADENADAADTLAVLLRLQGYEVATAYNGVDALMIARSTGLSAAVLALRLPLLDGYEVARRLRADSSGRRAPLLIALTGFGLESDRLRAKEAGFDHHLIKPADPEAILALLPAAGKVG